VSNTFYKNNLKIIKIIIDLKNIKLVLVFYKIARSTMKIKDKIKQKV